MATKKQLRNLPQYKDKTDAELDAIVYVIENPKETRIASKMAAFEKDYDLTDMSANDLMALEELAKVFVRLDAIDTHMDKFILSDDMDILVYERLARIASQLRGDASTIQKDLDITRKARSASGASSVTDTVEELLSRAGKFVEDRLVCVYCPECKMLLSKFWVLYKDAPYKLQFACGRDECGRKFEVTEKDIADLRNLEAGPRT